ncbi:DUF1802 family protein [bacterium]|nr:MAG: DUF1802 family protein [bacterium]
MSSTSVSSRAALKEWAISAESLAQGRQVLLLRKGGLHDEDGVFHLEHDSFYLLPTWFHQERGLVKAEHQDLWEQAARESDEGPKLAYLRHFAQVEEIWQLHENAESALKDAAHIYSTSYLDLRFSYQSNKPLLCAALRVWELETPVRYELRSEDLGCKSWVDWESPLITNATPALSDEDFARKLQELRDVLAPVVA